MSHTKYLAVVSCKWSSWNLLEFKRYVATCLLEIKGTVCYYQDTDIPKRSIPKELWVTKFVDGDPLKKAHHCKVCNPKLKWIAKLAKFMYMTNASHSTTSPNFHRGLIIKNVKTWFAVVFLFCDGKDSLWLYMLQKDCKNTCFLVVFPFVTETVCFWPFITPSFMQVGPFMPFISKPSKFMGF